MVKYTKEKCISVLKKLDKESNVPLYQSNYDEYKKDSYPSSWTIANKFGTWNKAKEEANLKMN